MALFGTSRDISLIRHLNREVINNIIETKIGYYKIALDKTEVNIYGESARKIFNDPVLLNCLISRGDLVTGVDEAGVTVNKTVSYSFLRDDLVGADIANIEKPGLPFGYNIVPEVGDVIMWDGNFYEVDGINENEYLFGKNPLYSYSLDTDDFGSSLSIVVSTHYIRPEKVGLKPERL